VQLALCPDHLKSALFHVCTGWMLYLGLARPIYTPYMTVYLVISLPKIPYIHHIYGSGQPYLYGKLQVTNSLLAIIQLSVTEGWGDRDRHTISLQQLYGVWFVWVVAAVLLCGILSSHLIMPPSTKIIVLSYTSSSCFPTSLHAHCWPVRLHNEWSMNSLCTSLPGTSKPTQQQWLCFAQHGSPWPSEY